MAWTLTHVCFLNSEGIHFCSTGQYFGFLSTNSPQVNDLTDQPD